MKALKSKLASQLLADPIAGEQLRHFLVNRRNGDVARGQGATAKFLVRGSDGEFEVRATFVPKAATAT